MNICFVGNGKKTQLFLPIANRLEKYGFGIFWILPTSNALIEAGNSLVLRRSEKVTDKYRDDLMRYIDVVSTDRILHHDIKKGKIDSIYWHSKIENFLKANNVTVCFGEITHTYEIITYRIARDLKLRYFCPHTIRYPVGRFGFFDDEFLSVLYGGSGSHNNIDIDNIFHEKPDYFYPHQKSSKKQYNIFRFLTRTKDDIQILPVGISWLKLQLKNLLLLILNGIIFEDKIEKNSKNIAYFYHVQPEASIDVSSRYQEDQPKIIETLARRGGQFDSLIVKLHPNAPNYDLVKLLRLRKKYSNVKLVKSSLASHEVISSVGLVLSCTGTVTIESQNLGVPSVNLVKTIFSSYGSVEVVNIWDRDFRIDDLFNSKLIDIASYINLICQKSYPGIIDTPDRIAGVNNGVNLECLVTAFLDVLGRVREELNRTGIGVL